MSGGVDASEGHGRIVKFTLSDGRVETGVVLPQEFSMSSLTHDPRRKLNSLQEIERYLDAGNWRTRVTGDYGLELSRNAICVDVKRGSGGNIYLDADSRAITGDFSRLGSRMKASLNESQFRELVPLLLRKTQLSGDLELMNKLRENSGDVKLDISDGSDGVGQAKHPRNWMADENSEVQIVQVEHPHALTTSMVENSLKRRIREYSRTHEGKAFEVKNAKTGMVARVDEHSATKMRSGKAVEKSSNPHIHAIAMLNVDKLFEKALLGVCHKDRKNTGNILQMHRFYVGMRYRGGLYGVKITVKEQPGTNHLYSIEARDIEVFEIKKPDMNRVSYRDMSHRPPEEKSAAWAALKQILHFRDFFEKFDPLNDLLGSGYSILRSGEKVKSGSEKNPDIPLSIQSPEISDAVTRGLKWFSRAVKYSRMKDSNGKTDISEKIVYYGKGTFSFAILPARNLRKIFRFFLFRHLKSSHCRAIVQETQRGVLYNGFK